MLSSNTGGTALQTGAASGTSGTAGTIAIVQQLIRQAPPSRDPRFLTGWGLETQFLTRVLQILVTFHRAAGRGTGTQPSGAGSSRLHINQLRGRAIPGRSAAARRRVQKKTHGQKFGTVAKGVASVATNVAGATIPGAGVLGAAFGKIAGGFGSSVAGRGGILGGATTSGQMSGGGQSMMSEMTQMNMQFLALQNALQMESRKFQTLSQASRARHDIAMKSIENTRA